MRDEVADFGFISAHLGICLEGSITCFINCSSTERDRDFVSLCWTTNGSATDASSAGEARCWDALWTILGSSTKDPHRALLSVGFGAKCLEVLWSIDGLASDCSGIFLIAGGIRFREALWTICGSSSGDLEDVELDMDMTCFGVGSCGTASDSVAGWASFRDAFWTTSGSTTKEPRRGLVSVALGAKFATDKGGSSSDDFMKEEPGRGLTSMAGKAGCCDTFWTSIGSSPDEGGLVLVASGGRCREALLATSGSFTDDFMKEELAGVLTSVAGGVGWGLTSIRNGVGSLFSSSFLPDSLSSTIFLSFFNFLFHPTSCFSSLSFPLSFKYFDALQYLVWYFWSILPTSRGLLPPSIGVHSASVHFCTPCFFLLLGMRWTKHWTHSNRLRNSAIIKHWMLQNAVNVLWNVYKESLLSCKVNVWVKYPQKICSR